MLSKVTLIAIAVSGVVPHVLAHGGVMSYSWGGSWYGGWVPYNSPTGQTTIERPWLTANPIRNATDPTIACNDDGTPGPLQLTATAAAGTAITAYWSAVWPHSIGPMTTYMANCDGDCTPVNPATLKWFKIDHAGLLSGTVANGSWADGKMIAQNSSWTSTIPSCIPAGNYMMRFETIAIHTIPSQFYLECAQITVTGGGRTVPHQTVTFPGGYSNSDPGLTVDIYSVSAQTQTNYTIPGPPLFTCNGGGGGGGTTTTKTTTATSTTATKSTTTISSSKSTTATPTTTSTTTTSTSTTGTSTTTASIPTQTHYGQCGGVTWNGPTACASPYTCEVNNAYYSQCL